MSVESFDSATCLHRRTVLAGVLAAGVTGGLAACGGGASAGPAVAAGVPFATTDEIPVGGGKIFGAEKIVVTQPKAGDFKAFTSICTHTGCPVSEVRDEGIFCGCHQSLFSISDGTVIRPPAPSPLAEKALMITGTSIALA